MEQLTEEIRELREEVVGLKGGLEKEIQQNKELKVIIFFDNLNIFAQVKILK